MLAEIASDPTVLPLWATLLFAATMYPLGLLLPGCVCCGSTGCTTCGNPMLPYEEQDTGKGRMCCSGTLAENVTVRITHQGDASASLAEYGGPYYDGSRTKTTRTIYCSSIDGDYVLTRNLGGSDYYTAECNGCFWAFYGSLYETTGMHAIRLFPDCLATSLPSPQWMLNCRMVPFVRYGEVYELCEAPCSTVSWVVSGSTESPYTNDDWGGAVGPFSEQHCSPPTGIILDDLQIVAQIGGTFRRPVLHTCLYTVEIV